MTACMLTLGSLYASGAGGGKIGKWVGVALIYLFIIAYVWDFGLHSLVLMIPWQ